MKFFILVVLSILASPVFASEEGGNAEKLPSSVVAHDPERGFRLTDPAIKRLGIQLQELKGSGPWNVPKTALVKVKRSTGVYRQVDGFISLVLVETTAADGDFVSIRSEELHTGDRIALTGGGFLRVVELDLSGDGGDSCGG